MPGEPLPVAAIRRAGKALDAQNVPPGTKEAPRFYHGPGGLYSVWEENGKQHSRSLETIDAWRNDDVR